MYRQFAHDDLQLTEFVCHTVAINIQVGSTIAFCLFEDRMFNPFPEGVYEADLVSSFHP